MTPVRITNINPSTISWPRFFRVLMTLINAVRASAPRSFFEHCDTLRAITAPLSARSARLLVGSILGLRGTAAGFPGHGGCPIR